MPSRARSRRDWGYLAFASGDLVLGNFMHDKFVKRRVILFRWWALCDSTHTHTYRTNAVVTHSSLCVHATAYPKSSPGLNYYLSSDSCDEQWQANAHGDSSEPMSEKCAKNFCWQLTTHFRARLSTIAISCGYVPPEYPSSNRVAEMHVLHLHANAFCQRRWQIKSRFVNHW